MIESQRVTAKGRSDFNLSKYIAPICTGESAKRLLRSSAGFWIRSLSKEGRKVGGFKESEVLFSVYFGLHDSSRGHSDFVQTGSDGFMLQCALTISKAI